MKSKLFYIYISLVAFIFIFIAIIAIYDVNSNTRQFHSFDSLVVWSGDRTIQADSMTILSGNVELSSTDANQLIFYSNHQNINVYCNDELIYYYPVKNNNPIAASPGYAWHFVPLPLGNNYLTITISSPYEIYGKKIPVFYLGNTLAIMAKLFDHNLPTFLMCTVIFFSGLGILIFCFIMRKKNLYSSSLVYLGIFACLLSIWSMIESSMTILVAKNNLATSYLSFLCLLLLPIPFAQFVKYFYKSTSKIWDIFCYISIVQIITVLLLQLFKIYDLRETLWTSHLLIISFAFIIIAHSVRLLLTRNASKRIVVHLISLLIYSASLALDLVAYYFGMWDNNTFGRIGLLIYFVIVTIYSFQESVDLMQLGKESKTYERLAFIDEMTGMKNRTAFIIDTKDIITYDNYAVISLDINHLKRTNDTFGHLSGDTYIREVVTLIKEIFSDIGDCYRMGGDEFEVLIPQSYTVNIDKLLRQLDIKINEKEWENKHQWMNIAHGYAIFDPSIDNNLMDTFKRADELMYKNKEIKKAQE